MRDEKLPMFMIIFMLILMNFLPKKILWADLYTYLKYTQSSQKVVFFEILFNKPHNTEK